MDPKHICLLSFLALIFIQCSTSTNSTTNDSTNENELYSQLCQSCHGLDGKKGLSGAKDLSISTLSLNETSEIITNGRNNMPQYKSILKKESLLLN